MVSVELFANLTVDGTPDERRGPIYFCGIELDRNPTNHLVEAAHIEREANLGTSFGDLKLAGATGVTRFELYAPRWH